MTDEEREEYNQFLIMLFAQMGNVLGHLRSDNISLAIISLEETRDKILDKGIIKWMQ